MTLFFSRRRYNRTTGKFTRARSKDTRYAEHAASTGKNEIIDQSIWLDRVMAAGGSNGVVIFVHGYNTMQFQLLDRMKKIEAGLKGNGYSGAVIAFDWPSEGRPTGYNSDKEDAEAVAHSLVEDAIFPLLNLSPAPKVHIFAHSMGAHLTTFGLGQFGDTVGLGGKWMIDQMCFASADMDAAQMDKGNQTALVVEYRSLRLTNYNNHSDVVLKWSRKFNGLRDRLGRAGLPQNISGEHFDVDCEARFETLDALNHNIEYFSHRWWFEDNALFFKDLAMTLNGRSATQMSTRDPGAALPRQRMKD